MKRILITLLAFAAFSLSAQNVPQGFTYQAVAISTEAEYQLGFDNVGRPVSEQSIEVRASIYSNAPTGTPDYEELHSVDTDIYGMFAIVVGQGIQISTDDFESIDWSVFPKYLKIELDINGDGTFQLSSVQELWSTPYALMALDVVNNNDPDHDTTNEIQALSLVNDSLRITLDNSFIDLSPYLDNTDQQQLSIVNDTVLRLTNSDSVIIPTRLGPTGLTGVGLDSSMVDTNGFLILYYDDGSIDTSGLVIGPQGPIGLTGPVGPQGVQGIQGIQGIQGDGIDSISTLPTGEIVLYINGSTDTTASLTGPQGIQGLTGNGVDSSEVLTSGELVLYYSNGTSDTLNNITGPQGPQGLQGLTGDAVDTSYINSNGHLILVMDSGQIINAGSAVGPMGPIGLQGPQGPQGAQGIQGIQGVQGIQGIQGIGVDTSYIDANDDLIIVLTDGSLINNGNVLGPQGPQGIQGIQGPQGVGISSAQVSAAGDFYLNYTNNTQAYIGNIAGPQGPAGNGIVGSVNNGNGTFTLTYSNGTTFTSTNLTGPQGPQGIAGPQGVQGPQGLQGAQGPQGVAGPAGNGITSTVDNFNGTYTFNYSDGSSFTTANLIGPQGPQGVQGIQGAQGPQGVQGIPGNGIVSTVNNLNGTYTFNYSDGTSFTTTSLIGPQGAQGLQGAQGPQGVQGVAGNGIVSTVNNLNGTYTFNYSDGTSFTTTSLIGPQGSTGPQGIQGPQGPQGNTGSQGPQGVGIANAVVTNGNLILTRTDNATINAGSVTGPQGPQGLTGVQGPAGTSVTNATINNNGDLLLSYSTGTIQNVGQVTGMQGPQGVSITGGSVDINNVLRLNLSTGAVLNVGQLNTSNAAVNHGNTQLTSSGSFTVPVGVREVEVTIIGARGGSGGQMDVVNNGSVQSSASGGNGGLRREIRFIMQVGAGDVLNFNVGSDGMDGSNSSWALVFNGPSSQVNAGAGTDGTSMTFSMNATTILEVTGGDGGDAAHVKQGQTVASQGGDGSNGALVYSSGYLNSGVMIVSDKINSTGASAPSITIRY